MTKQEIQALIDATIAGQGNQIDTAGSLAKILNGILDLATANVTPKVRIGTTLYDLELIEVPEHGAAFFVPVASPATGCADLIGYEEKP